MLSQYCDATHSRLDGRSRPRKLASPRRDALHEFRARTGRVGLDLSEGPSAGLRVRRRPHVPLDLLDAGATTLEAPEVQAPIAADFLLHETAPHFHGDTTEEMARESMKLSQY